MLIFPNCIITTIFGFGWYSGIRGNAVGYVSTTMTIWSFQCLLLWFSLPFLLTPHQIHILRICIGPGTIMFSANPASTATKLKRHCNNNHCCNNRNSWYLVWWKAETKSYSDWRCLPTDWGCFSVNFRCSVAFFIRACVLHPPGDVVASVWCVTYISVSSSNRNCFTQSVVV